MMNPPAASAVQTEQDSQFRLLSELLQLQQRARARETADELAFFIVNETHSLVKYRQALLWNNEQHRLQAVSGLASIDHNAPFSSTFSQWCRRWQAEQRQSGTLRCQELPVEDQALWHEYLPEHLLWLPLRSAQGETALTLILARETPWLAPEILLLDTLAEPYAHAWSSLHKQRRPTPTHPKKRRMVLFGAVALALILLIPVRQSVLAPTCQTAGQELLRFTI